MKEINDEASTLARLTLHWQMFAECGVPAAVLAAQAEILRRVSARLIVLLDQVPGNVRIDFDPFAAPYVVDLFAGDVEIPDALPEDWK